MKFLSRHATTKLSKHSRVQCKTLQTGKGDFILNPADLTHSLIPANSPAPGHRCPTGLPRITHSDTEDKGHQQGLVTPLLFFLGWQPHAGFGCASLGG